MFISALLKYRQPRSREVLIVALVTLIKPVLWPGLCSLIQVFAVILSTYSCCSNSDMHKNVSELQFKDESLHIICECRKVYIVTYPE